jgi:hypothetical protein
MIGGGGVELTSFQSSDLLSVTQYYLQLNEFLPVGKNRVKRFVPTCNLFCDRELFEKVNGFPNIRASEDVLFGINASKYESVWFFPKCTVYHIFDSSWKKMVTNQKMLGQYVATYRNQKKKRIYNNIFFQVLMFPFIPFLKYIMIFSRIIKAGSPHNLAFFKVTPLIIVGIFCWSFGYMTGCFIKQNEDI